jgi:hypothetical protein
MYDFFRWCEPKRLNNSDMSWEISVEKLFSPGMVEKLLPRSHEPKSVAMSPCLQYFCQILRMLLGCFSLALFAYLC